MHVLLQGIQEDTSNFKGFRKRGGALQCLQSLYYEQVLVEKGLFAKRDYAFLAASLDGISLLDLAQVTNISINPMAWSIPGAKGRHHPLATNDLKLQISAAGLSKVLSLSHQL